MTEYAVTAVDGGFEVADGDLSVTIGEPRIRAGRVRGVVTVRLGIVILARDQVALTSEKARKKLIQQIAEKDATLGEGALIALDEVVRSHEGGVQDSGPDTEERIREAAEKAGSLLTDVNITDRVDEAICAQGFAGDTTAAKIAYLIFTSRLTPRPVNAAFVGPSSSGKSYTVEVAANLFPDSAVYRLDGASQLALVYSEESFEHRSIFLAEADSLPEDGAAASALRAIVTNNRMVYVTVEKQGGSLTTRSIEKEGPTGLCTTSIRPPREQFSTRMLLISVPDSEAHHRAVLEAQAAAVNGHGPDFDATPFHAHQEWLQLAGDRGVAVPFSTALARAVPAKATRTLRDFRQLLSLVQASTILHQRHRERAMRRDGSSPPLPITRSSGSS